MVVIGVDQSYTCSGFSVVENGELIYLSSTKFKRCKTKAEKRRIFKKKLLKLLKKYKPEMIIVERVRQFSAGFMSMNAIACHIQLTTAVVDLADTFDLPVYSVDTRSWKAQILGSSKPSSDGDKKRPTIEYIAGLGWDIENNSDAADAGCIGLYAFIPKANQKLKLEQ